jgi:hypothetical protein
MRNHRRFQTFRPGKAQKFLRWAALNFLSLVMILPYRYEHPSARTALIAVLGISLAVLLALWWKIHRYESRRYFDS